jgi:hypothetical protein
MNTFVGKSHSGLVNTEKEGTQELNTSAMEDRIHQQVN